MKIKIILLLVLVANLATAQIRFGNQGRSQPNQINLSYSNPQEFTIAEINVEGAEYLDKIALVSISGLKVGDKIKIPGDGISAAIKKLWKQ